MINRKFLIIILIIAIVCIILILIFLISNKEEKSVYIKSVDYEKNVKVNENFTIKVAVKRADLGLFEFGTTDVWIPLINVTIYNVNGIIVINDSKEAYLPAWGDTDTLHFNFKLTELGKYNVKIELSWGKYSDEKNFLITAS